MFGFSFDNSYQRDLEGLYLNQPPVDAPKPELVLLNDDLAVALGLDPGALSGEGGADALAGVRPPVGAHPLAMAYAGHQFGHFSPQLGDGRAMLMGEQLAPDGKRFDIHLKGSGRTPFARGGDGKAVLGPVLREYLMGEAMHGLGVPTTRALAAIKTGETVLRQNGPEPGAILVRVAASHLRVGTFQFFAARQLVDELARLARYAARRHAPDLADLPLPDLALGLFACVRDAQADLIAQWMSIGFIHGVMNTDNMTISGETIDYGPCAFMDAYDPATVFSSIDHQGRYAYGNQPSIAQWNLARLAEALLPLIDADTPERAIERVTAELDVFPAHYQEAWLRRFRAKLGLRTEAGDDGPLIVDLLAMMEEGQADFTRTFRALSALCQGDATALRAEFTDPDRIAPWVERYRARLASDPEDGGRADAMNGVNPTVIPRNHLVEEALRAATAGDLQPFRRLLDEVTDPFRTRDAGDRLTLPAPAAFSQSFRTYCGT